MLIIVLLITAILAAGTAGLIALVCAGIASEEADMSLRLGPSTRRLGADPPHRRPAHHLPAVTRLTPPLAGTAGAVAAIPT